MFCCTDCHSHLANLDDESLKSLFSLLNRDDYSVFSSCSTLDEFEKVQNLKNLQKSYGNKIKISFGSLAQNPSLEVVQQLENLLRSENSIDAIGECGIDLFTSELKSSLDLQREVFDAQLELAKKYSKPVVVHQRKAMNEIFQFAPKLKELPFVFFHGYSGTSSEAQSILKKNVNAYFGFGKSILRGDKKALECFESARCGKLPKECLKAETDSPYQLPLEKIFDILDLCAKLLKS